MTATPNASRWVGTHDVLLVTLDTLRYDVAARLHADGRSVRGLEIEAAAGRVG